jgi:pyrroloquinoline-quinone synthase
MSSLPPSPWTPEEFRRKLEDVHSHYHHVHPFHVRMNAGTLSAEQLRGWVANRFYYQRSIPLKDAAILANCPIREVRRAWLHRISDHDGAQPGEGGIEAWLRLGEACGLDREELLQERYVVPGVRFAVDAYLTLARTRPWPVAVASSLTELFAPDLMAQRIKAFEEHYRWIPAWGLDYFRSRLTRARTDSEEAMELTLCYCDTRQLQEQAVAALRTKCDILSAQLDAIAAAYPDPPGRHEHFKEDHERSRT